MDKVLRFEGDCIEMLAHQSPQLYLLVTSGKGCARYGT